MLLLAASAAARSADAPPDPVEALDEVRYVLGAVLANGPIYFGQQERSTGLRPMLAVRWGRLRLSSSGASSLIGESNAGGASADLYTDPVWSLRAGLRLDRGRRISDDSSGRLAELPRVRGTLRWRLSANRALWEDAALNLSLSSDLLGRGGGSLLSVGVYQRLGTPGWLQPLGGQWSLSVGASGGDDRYMNSYFGIPVAGPRYAAYEAEGGLLDLHAGVGWRRSFGDKGAWVLFGGAGASRLLGSAADAPFVQRRSTWSAELGLAYRH